MSTLAADETYFDGVRRFPLRPLRSEREYKAGAAILFELSEKAEQGKASRGERDYLLALACFIENWDEKKGYLATSALKPLDLLKFLMEQRDMSVSDLGRVFGSQPGASLVLAGKRELSKLQIRAAAGYFRVDSWLFL